MNRKSFDDPVLKPKPTVIGYYRESETPNFFEATNSEHGGIDLNRCCPDNAISLGINVDSLGSFTFQADHSH